MNCYATRRLFVLASILCVVGNNATRADDSPVFNLNHCSLYQAEPIASAHRIDIVGSIQNGHGEGSIRFDGNKCFLNVFGDVEASTAVNYARLKVKFTRIEAQDNFKRDRDVYGVTGSLRKGLQLRLVVDPKTSPSTCRLVIIEDDKPTVLALISSEYAKDHEYSAPRIGLKPKESKTPAAPASVTKPAAQE
jgi:hypothetical protein